jgi:ATP-dependent DNA ligase
MRPSQVRRRGLAAPKVGATVDVKGGCSMPARCAAATEAVARHLHERLDPYIRKGSPLSEPVKKPKATWVEPVIQAELAYSTVTENKLLREAVFKGLHEDRNHRHGSR